MFTFKQRVRSVRRVTLSQVRGQTPFPELSSPIEVQVVSCESVELQECVGIACSPMTETIALLEQTSSPDHLPTLHGCIQVLLHTKHLHT